MKDFIVCDGPNCDFGSLIELTKVIINNLIYISTILAVIAFIYIGFVLLTSGGDVGAKTKAKHAALSVLKGFIIILTAWFIVYTITSVLLNDGYSLLQRL